MIRLLAFALSLIAALAALAGRASACGCFLPPDPIQPLVQTGERILFRVKNGTVTAHIQIAFAGKDTTQFGWTVPVPSVPTLEVGDDAVFNVLNEETGPQYNLETNYECRSAATLHTAGGSGCGCDWPYRFDNQSGGGGRSSNRTPVSPDIVVIRSTVGPYDFAVLKANDKNDLILWLNLNRFFLPAASDDLLKPYIGPGLYFLALKMKPGSDAGDIKPIVLTYSSDLPMIPLTLTAATTAPKLPVQVFMLGDGRAIPRNYHHVVIDDALLAWQDKVRNYEEVLAAAIAEAPGGHAFVTEYAGSSVGVQAKVPEKFRALFDGAPTLTRLYTVLAASALDKDPVFSTNPDLPLVPRTHDAPSPTTATARESSPRRSGSRCRSRMPCRRSRRPVCHRRRASRCCGRRGRPRSRSTTTT